ncbi:MAG: ribonuclease P protein component [Bacteroidetes bacterium]|nr:ribonuclease P protein component [Bacteroidota bacterium]
MRQFTLGKQERLKSRKLIEQLFSKGKSFNAFPFRVIYLLEPELFISKKPKAQNDSTRLQFGVGASSRNFKKAVDRNRIKRLAREAYRKQKNELETLLIERKIDLAVFFIYNGKDLPDQKTVNEKIALILQRLMQMVHESNT